MKITEASVATTTPTSLRVLVCSGNLGNAEPDVKSLEAWVPQNGNCKEVIDQEAQKYPLRLPVPKSSKNSDKDGKFELIVLGLQEATFVAREEEDEEEQEEQGTFENESAEEEGEEGEEDHDSTREQPNSSRSLRSTASNRSRSSSSASSIAKRVSNNLKKISWKGASTIDGVTASANHTSKDLSVSLIDTGTTSLHKLLEDRLPSYKRLLSFQRGALRILVYALTEESTCTGTPVHSIRVRSVRAKNTGVGGLANKGGIVAEVIVNDTTTLTFVSCHLDAHEGIDKYKARLESIKEILDGTKQGAVPSIFPDVSVASHYCFFSGDLNFRTRLDGRIKSEEQRDDVLALIEQQNWKELYSADELKMAIDDQECLYGFQTLDCNFPPTFKVRRDDINFVYNEKRIPSYTDRILWKSGNGLSSGVTPLVYEPIPHFTSSDHKPIRGAFELQLNQPYQLSTPSHRLRNTFLHRWTHPNRTSTEPGNLHLYVSDIQIDLLPSRCAGGDHTSSGGSTEEDGKAPDTYLCLVTNPQELLLKPRSLWQQCVYAVKSLLCMYDNGYHRKVKSWPRTPSRTSTYNPNWGDNYELHCKLRGFDPDENFRHLQFGGSLLYLFVFQDNGSKSADRVLGYFPINLENLYRGCLEDDFTPNFDDCLSDNNGHGTKAATTSTITVHETATPKMLSLDIVDAPLLKDGLETGVIRCSLDAWWVKDVLAKAAKAGNMSKGLASSDTADDDEFDYDE